MKKRTKKDSNDFLQELNKLTGLSMRLPTEAEWEFAARGGKYSNGYAYSGGNKLSTIANYHDYYTSRCGVLNANELGLYDMHGNVWEYCRDYYQDWSYNPATVPAGDDPIDLHDSQGGSRVIRGGSFNYPGFSYWEGRGWDRVEVFDGFIGVRNNRGGIQEIDSRKDVGFRPAL